MTIINQYYEVIVPAGTKYIAHCPSSNNIRLHFVGTDGASSAAAVDFIQFSLNVNNNVYVEGLASVFFDCTAATTTRITCRDGAVT